MSVKVFTFPESKQVEAENFVPTKEFYFEMPLLPNHYLEISHFDLNWKLPNTKSCKREYIKSFIINPWDCYDGLPFIFTWKNCITNDVEFQEHILFKECLKVGKDDFFKDSRECSPLIEPEF